MCGVGGEEVVCAGPTDYSVVSAGERRRRRRSGCVCLWRVYGNTEESRYIEYR